MEIKWNENKNNLIKQIHGVSFEQVVAEISAGRFIGPEENPNHKNQKRIIVKIDEYPVVVPFVITEDGDWFLKTAYLSRKMKGRI